MYPSAIPGSIASTADLRKHNCFQVYHHIYHQKQITQAALMQDLKMSAPTISQYLNELLAAGFIEKSGFASSSGGRKPSLFRIIPDARISAGLEIVSSRVLLIITNLYGEVIFKKQLTAEFSNAPSYFDTVCQWANQCIRQTVPDDGRMLGIGIAVQGLPTVDGLAGEMSHLPGTMFRLEQFSSRLHYPCSWIHDVELAAKAEIWHNPQIENAFFLSLNRELGSALIINHSIHTGFGNFSSIIEHMCLYPGGRTCYCGKSGCVDAYCSSFALSQIAGKPLDAFFSRLRLGNEPERNIWDKYLHDLAMTIDNVRMIIRNNILLGGEVETYMTEEDIRRLATYVEEMTIIKANDLTISRGFYGKNAAAIGGSLYYIEQFLALLPSQAEAAGRTNHL